jgi:hypothetical protein
MSTTVTIDELRSMSRAQRIPCLKAILIDAVEATLDQDAALFAIGVHEQTVCHRIAFHMERRWDSMGGMSIDCEYNRDVGRYKEFDFEVTGRKKLFRPDIVLHERLNGNHNMLAVESKPERGGDAPAANDKKKIERIVEQRPYEYDLGCFLRFLNGPRRRNAGVIVQFFIKGSQWSESEQFTKVFDEELMALSFSRKISQSGNELLA